MVSKLAVGQKPTFAQRVLNNEQGTHREIPYVTERDIVRWEQVLSRIEPTIAADIAEKRLQTGRRIAQHFRNRINAGLIAYAKGDDCVTLRDFNDAVARFMLFFESGYAHEVDPTYVYETSAEVLEIALITQSPFLMKVAEILLPLHFERSDPRSIYVRALSFLILGDRDSTDTEAAALVKLNSRQFGMAIPTAILAIVNGYPDDFLENVHAAINGFDSLCATEARGTPEAVIFLSGAALIKLFERCNGEKLLGSDLDVRLMPG